MASLHGAISGLGVGFLQDGRAGRWQCRQIAYPSRAPPIERAIEPGGNLSAEANGHQPVFALILFCNKALDFFSNCCCYAQFKGTRSAY